ncbi:MAG: hypothetical protein E6L09_04890 [Verrucomicrobia bacterium]|nr:MAG: hypothetical protein E6L09_04890 [Verrucomicrobiota bacterium]
MRSNFHYQRAVHFTTRADQPRQGAFFDRPFACPTLLAVASILCLLICLPRARAEITTVVFSDDFSSNTIDTNKYQPDAPFFEGGIGDIHATAHDGVIEFVGTTTQQWWSGGTLRIVPTFDASEATPLAVSIDRVAEAGVGTASRSALWILDETKTKYVLFADVRGEGGWRYNRKIGEDGDVPTGSSTDIVVFNDPSFDDGGLPGRPIRRRSEIPVLQGGGGVRQLRAGGPGHGGHDLG